MERKEFIEKCTFVCLGIAGLSVFMQSCTPAKYVQVNKENNQLKIARSEFFKETQARKYIVVKAVELNFPIVVYRFSDTDYSALLLQCTHQGVELNVNGDVLTCSAHNSEFSNKGSVIQGPAEQKLVSYKVSSDTENIYIHL